MDYTKKEWVNVPDPSKFTEEQLNSFARFDANNMNRIESGINEVYTPIYTESTKLTTLTSGEKIGIAFGKVKKAISELISHLSNKKNPHEVTAAQAGALPISGGVISGKSVGLASGYGSIASDKNCTTIIAKNLTDSADNSRQIYVTNSGYTPKVDDSIFLHDTIDGVAKKYNIYGEHNRESTRIPYIQTRTYKGTGSGKKVTLTFDFVPKIVFIQRGTREGRNDNAILINGVSEANLFPTFGSVSGSVADVSVTWSGKSLTFMTTDDNACINDSGITYYCVALG